MRQHTRIITIVVAVALLVLFALLALLGPATDDDPEPPDEPVEAARSQRLVAALSAPVEELDPHAATSEGAVMVLDQVYDTLVRLGDDLLPQPALADSWEVADDGLTWTFELRDDVVFHDGSPLTADDVVASLERVAGEGVDAGRLEVVEEIEAEDDHTVVLQLTEPTGALLAHLGASPRLAIMPSEHLDADDLAERPVGSGPFRFVTGTDTAIDLEPFDEHWSGAPQVDALDFRVADAATALAALRDGDVHWVGSVPGEEMSDLEDDADVHLARRAGPEYWHLAFNFDREPLDEVDVRQAVALALDREQIAEAARPGGATPNHSPLPPDSFWYEEHTPFEHDPDRARELIEDVGLETQVLELLVTDELPESADVAEAVAEQLEAVGLEVEIRTEDLEDLLTAQAEGDFDLFALGWRGGVDPGELLHAPHHSEGSRNFQGFADEEVDEALDAAREAHDPDVRREHLVAATRAIVDEVAYAYLFNTDVVRAWSPDLEGVELRPDGAVRFTDARLPR